MARRRSLGLVHNVDSGDASPPAELLVGVLEEAGYDVCYRSTDEAWHEALDRPVDLVVAAGGDGTVAHVAAALLGRPVPLAILPFGTANNVAKALGISRDGDAPTAARGWATAQQRPFDVWSVATDGREATFVESMGGGFLGQQMKSAAAIEPPSLILGNELERALHLLQRAVLEAPESHWDVELDGEDLSGDYIAVEALNIRSVGPNLPLAPEADSGDEALDLVLVSGAHREPLLRRLSAVATAHPAATLSIPVRRGREMRLRPPRRIDFHLDGALWDPEADRRGGVHHELTITLAGQVRVLTPT